MFSNKGNSASIIVTLIVTLFLLATGTSSSAASEQQQVSAVEDLWIDMRIGPPLIPLFNETAHENDIARVEHPSLVKQLNGIENGRKMVIFQSVAEARELLPDMASGLDVIGYNLEHGQRTPEEEKADPVDSIRQMRELADDYRLELAFGPDHDFALSHGVEAAPFIDIFVMQIQRQQTNPAVVEAFVIPLAPQLRAANPDLQISVQVRTEGDVQAIITLLDSLKEHLDGVSILTSPDTVEVAEELITALRPGLQPEDRYLLLAAAALIAAAIGLYLLRRKSTTNNQES